MERKNNNNIQYLQVIHHHIFLQVVLLFYFQDEMVDLMVYYLLAEKSICLLMIIKIHELFQTILLIDSVAFHRTRSTDYITLFSASSYLLKGTLIITSVESVDVLKTISTTHITIIGITILLGEFVVVHRTIPTTHDTHF